MTGLLILFLSVDTETIIVILNVEVEIVGYKSTSTR